MVTPRPPKKLGPDRLWDYALRLLGHRGYSAGEMRLKLSLKAETVSVLNEVMAKLKEYGYLDDKKFAETYAANRRENDSLGRLRILRELRARRVSQANAERAVNRVFAATDEQVLAATYLERKFRGKNLTEYLHDEAKLASVFRRLRRAGFSSSATISVLKSFTTKASELENLPDEPGLDHDPDGDQNPTEDV
ncbi:MAG: regulatory protein RecX [Bryobacteraceae bacterium]